MPIYAIIETGSKQYRVQPKDILEVEKLSLPEDQKEVELTKVLLVHDGEKVQVGNPTVAGASVICDYLGPMRGRKVISFKFRCKKNSRRIKGHRQDYTRLLVKEIKTH